MRIRELIFLLLIAALPCRADVPLGVKRIGVAPVHENADRIVATCGPSECLAVWVQRGVPHAMRMNLAGEPLLERPIPLDLVAELSRSRPLPTAVAAATDGSNYLVLFDSLVIRISADGEVTSVAPELAYFGSSVTSVTIVWTGQYYVGLRSRLTGIDACVLDRDGRVVRGVFPIAKSAGGNLRQVSATLIPDGRIAIFWADSGAVNGHFVTANELLDPAFVPWTQAPLPGIRQNFTNLVDVRSTRSELLLVSIGAASSGQFLDFDGKPLGPEFGFGGDHPFVVASADRYHAISSALAANLVLSSSRVSLARGIEDPTPIRVAEVAPPAGFGGPTATGNSAGALVVWLEAPAPRQRTLQVRAELVESSTGRPRHAGGRGVLLSTGYAWQGSPVVAQRSDGQLFAWIEEAETNRLLIERHDAGGARIDAEPAAVEAAAGAQRAPAIATDGAGALLAWYEVAGPFDETVKVAYVNARSIAVQPAFSLATIRSGERAPALACSGRQYVVAWSAAGEILLARVALDGTLIDRAPITFRPMFADPDGRQVVRHSTPQLVWTGREFYLVYESWTADATVPPFDGLYYYWFRELHGVRLSEELVPIGAERLVSAPQRNAADAEQAVLAVAGDSVFVAWKQTPALFDPQLLMVRRIAANDDVLPADSRPSPAGPLTLNGVGNEARLTAGTSVFRIDGEGRIVAERIVDDAIAGATVSGSRLTLIEAKRDDDAVRLFAVPLPPARARAVQR